MSYLILTPGGALHPAMPYASGSMIATAPDVPCPLCNAPRLDVHGTVQHIIRNDNHERCCEWDAETICCHRPGFTIGVKEISLFGFDEDRRVLNGRARVY